MAGSLLSALSGSLVSARATAAAAAGSLVSALSDSLVRALSGSLWVPRPRGLWGGRVEIAERALPVMLVRFADCLAVIMRCRGDRSPTHWRVVGMRH